MVIALLRAETLGYNVSANMILFNKVEVIFWLIGTNVQNRIDLNTLESDSR